MFAPLEQTIIHYYTLFYQDNSSIVTIYETIYKLIKRFKLFSDLIVQQTGNEDTNIIQHSTSNTNVVQLNWCMSTILSAKVQNVTDA